MSYALQAIEEWSGIFGYNTNVYQFKGYQGYEKEIYGPNLQSKYRVSSIDIPCVDSDSFSIRF